MSGATCATCRHLRGNTCCRFPPREGDIAIAYPAKMFCGEHAPTPAVGVPGLPELPDGWRWDDTYGPDYLRAFLTGSGGVGRLEVGPTKVRANDVPTAFLLAAIAYYEAHRARAGGAA